MHLPLLPDRQHVGQLRCCHPLELVRCQRSEPSRLSVGSCIGVAPVSRRRVRSSSCSACLDPDAPGSTPKHTPEGRSVAPVRPGWCTVGAAPRTWGCHGFCDESSGSGGVLFGLDIGGVRPWFSVSLGEDAVTAVGGANRGPRRRWWWRRAARWVAERTGVVAAADTPPVTRFGWWAFATLVAASGALVLGSVASRWWVVAAVAAAGVAWWAQRHADGDR